MSERRTSLGNRILAVLLAAVMVIGLVPARALAQASAGTDTSIGSGTVTVEPADTAAPTGGTDSVSADVQIGTGDGTGEVSVSNLTGALTAESYQVVLAYNNGVKYIYVTSENALASKEIKTDDPVDATTYKWTLKRVGENQYTIHTADDASSLGIASSKASLGASPATLTFAYNEAGYYTIQTDGGIYVSGATGEFQLKDNASNTQQKWQLITVTSGTATTYTVTVSNQAYANSGIALTTANPTATLTAPTLSAVVKGTEQAATVSAHTGVWSVEDPTVAKVENGVVTGLKSGSTVISYTVSSVTIGEAAACELVVKIPVKVALNENYGLSFQVPATVSMIVGDTYQAAPFQVTLTPAYSGNQAVTYAYASDNAAAAEVSESGLITAKGEGTANITVTAKTLDGRTVTDAVPATITVTVTAEQAGRTTTGPSQDDDLTHGKWILSGYAAAVGNTVYRNAQTITSGKQYAILRDGAEYYLGTACTSAKVTWSGDADAGFQGTVDVWTIQSTDNEYYHIINAENKYLTAQDDSNDLTVTTEPGELAKFQIQLVENSTEGQFNITTKAPAGNSDPKRSDVSIPEEKTAKLESKAQTIIIRQQSSSGNATPNAWMRLNAKDITVDASAAEADIIAQIQSVCTLERAPSEDGAGAATVAWADANASVTLAKTEDGYQATVSVPVTNGSGSAELGKVNVTVTGTQPTTPPTVERFTIDVENPLTLAIGAQSAVVNVNTVRFSDGTTLETMQAVEDAGYSSSLSFTGEGLTISGNQITAVAAGDHTVTVNLMKDGATVKTLELTVNVHAEAACEHGKTEIRNWKNATCAAEGYTGDTYCTECQELVTTGTAISATGEHTYVNGKCTVCGTVQAAAGTYTHNIATDTRYADTTNGNLFVFTVDVTEENSKSVFYNGMNISPVGKFETKTNITFTAPADGKLRLIFIESSIGIDFKINEESHTIKEATVEGDTYGLLELDCTKDTQYSLMRGKGGIYIAYLEYIPSDVTVNTYVAGLTLKKDKLVIGSKTEGKDTTTATGELQLNGAATTEYAPDYTSSKPEVATVEAKTGDIKALTVGETQITVTYTVEGQPYTATQTLRVQNADAVNSGVLSSRTVKVNQGETLTQDLLKDESGNDITLTVTYADGDTETVELATSDKISFAPALSEVNTATTGNKAVQVLFNGVQMATLTVQVTDPALEGVDAYVDAVINREYILDTNGIEDGEKYLIVYIPDPTGDKADGKALTNPDPESDSQKQGTSTAVTAHKDATGSYATFTGSDAALLWTAEKSGNGWKLTNNKRALYNGSSPLKKLADATTVTIEKSTTNPGAYYIELQNDKYYLSVEGNNWKRSNSATNGLFYFYKLTPETQRQVVTFDSKPENETIRLEEIASITNTVTAGGVAVTDYTVTYTSSDPDAVAVVNNQLVGKGAGTATITATLTKVNGDPVMGKDGNPGISETFTLTVKQETVTYSLDPLHVRLNGAIDVTKVQITRTSNMEPLTQTAYIGERGITCDLAMENIDTSVPGTYYADIYRNGVALKNQDTSKVQLKIIVENDPYYGLNATTATPEYPNPGAVRINKTAVGQDFRNTGIAKLELTAAGITTQTDVDVVLIVDVSNSMSDTAEGSTRNKLADAMAGASDFAEILLASDNDNSLSFVTFAANDEDNLPDNLKGENVDSVMTVFTNVKSADDAVKSFSNTKISDSTLTIAGTNGVAIVSGKNYGNTNYDYAFNQAMDAVEKIYEANGGKDKYLTSGRQIHIVFMTDGAASHYNDQKVNGDRDYYLWGTKETYKKNGTVSAKAPEWYTDYLSHNNKYATQLAAMSGVMGFYAVGFDLANGGFTGYSWTAEQLGEVLRGLVANRSIPVTTAEDGAALDAFFTGLANSLVLAGTDALVADVIGHDYKLYTGGALFSEIDDTSLETKPSDIQVKQYALITQEYIDAHPDKDYTTADIGRRICEVEGETAENVTVLETITFVNGEPTGDGVKVLEGGGFETKTFTYKVNEDGNGSIEWKVQNITHHEVALSYYVQLNDVGDGKTTTKPDGTYFTNESATITYVDAQEQKVTLTYRRPELTYGTSAVVFRFVLVDENGHYANRAGNPFTSDLHANRIFTVEQVVRRVGDSSSAQYSVAQLMEEAQIGAKYAPYGGANTVFTVSNKEGEAILSGPSGHVNPTNVFDGKDGCGQIHNVKNLLQVNSYNKDRSQIVIEIPVMSLGNEMSDSRLVPVQTVIDFGTPVEFGILTDAESQGMQDYTMTIVGFATYDENFEQKRHLKPAWVTAVGKETLDTGCGIFSMVDGKTSSKNGGTPTVCFTPTAPLSGVQRAFAIVCFTIPGREDETYYYMYKEIAAVPASMVLYESDLPGFSYTGDWKTASAVPEKGNATQFTAPTPALQSTENSGYGFDTSYANFKNFSGGAAKWVNNKGPVNKRDTVEFTFTGTGFDLISYTGPNQGGIRVDVYKHGTAERVKVASIVNKGLDKLYQLPVISLEGEDGLPYGTYDVKITVFPAVGTFLGGEFHFDAIRVYNAAQESEVLNSEKGITVEILYKAAGEFGMKLTEIRDLILEQKDFTYEGSQVPGAVYIDGAQHEDKDLVGENGFDSMISAYEKIGPKNEVYLGTDQLIAFTLKFEGDLPTTLDLGLKSADGNRVTAEIQVVTPGESGKFIQREIPIDTATTMFYDILQTNNGAAVLSEYVQKAEDGTSQVVVVVKNTGSGVLSITDLKTASHDTVVGNISLVSDATTTGVAYQALYPKFDVKSAAFVQDKVTALLSNAALVTTGRNVWGIAVVDANGNRVPVSVSYLDTGDNERTWTVILKPMDLGDQSFTFIGLDANGNPVEGAQTVTVHTQVTY